MKFAVFVLFTLFVCVISEGKYTRRSGGRRRYSSPSDCNVSQKDALNYYQQLYLVGDENMLLPKDHCGVMDHCDKTQDLAKKDLDFVKCLQQGSAKLIFDTLARGFIAQNQNRCAKKQWREDFLDFADCVRKSDAANDVHQCGYMLNDALQYSLDNFDVDQQLQFSCCAFLKMDACIHKRVVKDCGNKVGEFAPELFYKPSETAFTVSCPGVDSIAQCRMMYPKGMQQIDKIFLSKKKLSARNFIEPYFKILSNRGSNLPEYIDVKNYN